MEVANKDIYKKRAVITSKFNFQIDQTTTLNKNYRAMQS